MEDGNMKSAARDMGVETGTMARVLDAARASNPFTGAARMKRM